MGARGLAGRSWCGWSTSRLRQAGLLSDGSPDDDAVLDAIFADSPYLTEYFLTPWAPGDPGAGRTAYRLGWRREIALPPPPGT